MSAYEIKLHFERDELGGPHACIVVRDPFWPADETLAITPECVWTGELEEQVTRIKKELDKILQSGTRQFEKAKRDRAAKARGKTESNTSPAL